MFSVQCRCGYIEEHITSDKAAQITADTHIVLTMRRPYQHSTKVVRERVEQRNVATASRRKGYNAILGRF
jgi:hypothetical protein